MTIERRYPYPSTIINSHDEVEEDDDRSVFINHHVPNTFWSVLATSIACLGGLIFGKHKATNMVEE
jgi:hypothetical protein